jgi:hypothetical protein
VEIVLFSFYSAQQMAQKLNFMNVPRNRITLGFVLIVSCWRRKIFSANLYCSILVVFNFFEMCCRRAIYGLTFSLSSVTQNLHLVKPPIHLQFRVLQPAFGVQNRFYAKGKSRGGADGKNKKKTTTSVNENELAEIVAVDTMKTQMQKALDMLKDEYIRNLSLRSTTGKLKF